MLLIADAGYTPYQATIAISRKMVEEKKDLVQRFVDATLEGWAQYLKGGPAIEAANALIKQNNPEQTDGRLAYAIKVLNERGIVMSGDALKGGIGAMSAERWQSFYDSMVAVGVLPPGLDVARTPHAGIREQGHRKVIGEDGMHKVSEEHEMLRELVKKFVRNELMPLEKNILDRFAAGQPAALSDEENQKLFKQCKELGLWALDVPEEAGGANLPAVALVGVNEELGYTAVPFTFPPDSPNLHMMLATVTPEQRKKYLEPYAAGETTSAIAISEPGAGGDPAGMKTKRGEGRRSLGDQRPQDLDQPHRQGRLHHRHGGDRSRTSARAAASPPSWSTRAPRAWWWRAPFPCWPASAPTRSCSRIAACMRARCWAASAQGFAPMQLRLTVRRLQMGSWCVGMAQRALDMLVEHANQRVTFGQKLADRQAIQWWIADAATKLHACRLMVMDAAVKQDEGRDVRMEASMIKVFATEMATEVIDHAQQAFGAMGVTQELPLSWLAQKVRTMRVYEGPSEVHRMVIARRILGGR